MATQADLKKQFLGKTLDDVPTPSAILDLAKLEVNCQRMLDTVKELGLGWRAHIKTHKTVELTRLQVGDNDSTPANIVVSTLLEAEKIVPLLKEYQSRGRKVNLLYSFPLYPSAIPRLSAISTALGPSGLSIMIDHEKQLSLLAPLTKQSGHPPLVFLKIDMGYHRAGVPPDTPACTALITALLTAHDAGHALFHGLYCHAGQSYNSRTAAHAVRHLHDEFATLARAAGAVHARRPAFPLTLSVGATPTATTLQQQQGHGPLGMLLMVLRERAPLALEVHAGVYPTLDVQQLATRARTPAAGLAAGDLALTVLAEVAAVYAGRGADGASAEALVNAGSLALGREPMSRVEAPGDYAAWGLVAPWRVRTGVPGVGFPGEHGGWQVERISQEHGILGWKGGEGEGEGELEVGQRVRIWPNHACIAGAGYDYYLIVDSRLKGREDEVVDVWERWHGW